jgi:hypothetical protein
VDHEVTRPKGNERDENEKDYICLRKGDRGIIEWDRVNATIRDEWSIRERNLLGII